MMSTTNSNHVTPTTLWNGVGIQEGQIIQGKYKISKLLGEGGMGQVFLADQENLRRKVVLKILKPSLCTNQIQVQRFQREAELASQLNHPHTITVYDFGIEQGIPYIAMEFLEGECLSDALEKGRVFSSDEILEMMKQICSSLAQAHEKGMIHRDLKPENIFLLNKENRIFVKVLDFGIAKVMDSQQSGHQKLTQGDMIFGTPHYMSPEQIKGEELDQRSDVYALGVMLYQIITTQLPFQSDSVIEILTKHITNEVPLVDLSRYSQDEKLKLQSINTFITKAMAKNRNDRIPTVAAFSEELSQSLERQIGFKTPSLVEIKPIQKSELPLKKILLSLIILLLAAFISVPYLPNEMQSTIHQKLSSIHPSLSKRLIGQSTDQANQQTEISNTVPSTPTEKVEEVPTTPTTPTEKVEEVPTTPIEKVEEVPTTPTTPTEKVEEAPTTPTEKVEEVPTTPTTPTEKVEEVPTTPTTPTEKVEEVPTTPTTPTEKVEEVPTTPTTDQSTDTPPKMGILIISSIKPKTKVTIGDQVIEVGKKTINHELPVDTYLVTCQSGKDKIDYKIKLTTRKKIECFK